MVEQGSHNPRVGSSSLPAATSFPGSLGAAARRFEHAVLDAIQGEALFPGAARLVVAVSGGPDSMCLLSVLQRLAGRPERRDALVVAHLNHRLRAAESDRDALFVAATARAAGVPCVIEELTPGELASGNLEAGARGARYRFLARVARASAADAICVAHTRDDQAETVLLRLARGAGARALAAMAPRRADGVVRPLLDRSRAECVAYLAARGGIAVHDRSNEDRTRLRNRVRREVLPGLERSLEVDIGGRLARLASDLRIESELAERFLAHLLADSENPSRLSIGRLLAAGRAAARLVHAWLARAGAHASERQIEAVVRIACGVRPSARVDLAGGLCVRRRYGDLVLGPARSESATDRWAPVELPVPGEASLPGGWRIRAEPAEADSGPPADPEASRVRLVPSAVSWPLRARPPQPGDRIRLAFGRRKLADILIDRRIARLDRAQLVVVAGADDRVVWVPGVVVAAGLLPDGGGERPIALRATGPLLATISRRRPLDDRMTRS